MTSNATSTPARRPLLFANGINVNYGKIAAVRQVSITIDHGEIVTLIGSNGAGKSSLINAICRLRQWSGSSLEFDGHDVAGLRADQLPYLGLVQVPEGRRVFTRLTVEENLTLGAFCRSCSAKKLESDIAEVYQLFPRLAERRAQQSGTLSGGEQQMLAIGRALMAKPKLLLLDEPSMGLAPRMIDIIYGAIESVVQQNVSLLIVEQNAFLALELAKRVYVMEAGAITLSGPADVLASDPRLKEAYLGG